MPSTITEWGYYQEHWDGIFHTGIFQNCKSLRSVDLSATSISSLGDQCFSGCESLEEIKLPINSLTIISINSFHGCSNLKNIKIPSSVKKIQQTAFGFSNSFGFELYLQYDGTLEDFNSIQKGSNNISAWYENITLIIEASDGTTVFN